MKAEAESIKQERFAWGLLLSWVPFLLLMAPGFNKSMGGTQGPPYGAQLLSRGFVCLFCALGAVMLARVFSKGRVFSTISLSLLALLSGLIVAALGGYVWLCVLHSGSEAELGFFILGCIAWAGFEFAGVVLLFSSFDKGRAARGVISALSICCSGLKVAVVVFYLWLVSSFRGGF
jgi:hypothetical protein